MSEKHYSAALEIIIRRRLTAQSDREKHILELRTRVPEIEEINNMISQASVNILKVISKGENVREEMKKLEEQNTEAQAMMRGLLVKNGYPENYMDINYTCKRCSDTGFTSEGRCSCLEELAGKLAVKELNESSPLNLSTFSTFDLEYYRGVSTDTDSNCYSTMSNIYNYCRKYASSFSHDSANIFMSGETGLGKTHLSLAIAERLLSENYSVVYGSVINFIDRIESEHFGRSSGDTLSVLINAELLILDDLGSEYDKQFTTATLYNIINTRLNTRLPTIISTNLSFEEIEARYEQRIVSRIISEYDYLPFSGNDVRQLKKAASIRQKRNQG